MGHPEGWGEVGRSGRALPDTPPCPTMKLSVEDGAPETGNSNDNCRFLRNDNQESNSNGNGNNKSLYLFFFTSNARIRRRG
jgi:hypothetical protein